MILVNMLLFVLILDDTDIFLDVFVKNNQQITEYKEHISTSYIFVQIWEKNG